MNKRLNINIPSNLMHKIKDIANEQNTTINNVIEEIYKTELRKILAVNTFFGKKYNQN